MSDRIAYQGEPGANSHIACRLYRSDMEPLALKTFDQVFKALENQGAEFAMIPIENSIAGRVSDIHRLMPVSNLQIIGEYFLKIEHCLIAKKGATLEDLKTVQSHEMALSQCRKTIEDLGLEPIVGADTAGSAREISETNDRGLSAIASPLAAEIYNLNILKKNMEDTGKNTTRFLILSKDGQKPKIDEGPAITTIIFKVKNVPSALYKALGGFATNGVNMLKLESYQVDGSFQSTQFYADLEGHNDQDSVKLALEELSFYSEEVKILGVYPSAR